MKNTTQLNRRLNLLREELLRLLWPFGWGVERWDDVRYGAPIWETDYLATFKLLYTVRHPDGVLDGQLLSLSQSISRPEAAHYLNDDRYWDDLAYRWAQDTLLQTLSLVRKAKLEATEVDWRPTEAIPEDFYSA